MSTALTVQDGGRAGRTPPHDLDAERSLLGGILECPQKLDEMALLLTSTDFYRPAHGKVFAAMCALAEDNEPIDRVTVTDRLRTDQHLEAAGGTDYLDILDKFMPLAANLDYYARIIRDKADLRALIEVCATVATRAYETRGSARKLIGEAEKLLYAITREESATGFRSARELVTRAMKRLEMLHSGEREPDGIMSGLEDFDHLTRGLRPAQLVIIAARPSMGKSALVMQWAMNIASTTDGTVGVFSLEMSGDELADRMLANLGRVSNSKMRDASFSEGEWDRLMNAAAKLAMTNLFIDETLHTSITELRAKARRKSREAEEAGHPLKLIVIDYLQLAGEFGEEREQEIAAISRGLKALAKELAIPVVALSQLNRKCESRPDKRPVMSDLRDSGAVEQDADLIVFIYRDEVYEKNSSKKGIAELIIGKQRAGPFPATVEVAFTGEYTAFDNLAPYLAAPKPKQLPLAAEPPPHTDDDR